MGLELETFWLVVALLFVLGGVWETLDVRFSLMPFILIAAGLSLLLSGMRRLI